MKKIINKSNKKLVFPKFDLVIEPEEIKEVTNELATELLGNHSIKEILPKASTVKAEEETLKPKGRTKNTRTINRK
ncbi:MAG: hypothetical protein WC346_09605 [Methanogenium sp.]|jgi:hypothetical protein